MAFSAGLAAGLAGFLAGKYPAAFNLVLWPFATRWAAYFLASCVVISGVGIFILLRGNDKLVGVGRWLAVGGAIVFACVSIVRVLVTLN